MTRITKLLALGCACSANAATFYVAPAGSNDNPGTEGKPFRTVAHAVESMVAGDTTYVRGGLYAEGEIRFRRPGTSTSPIRLLNYPGELPVIQFTGQTELHRVIVQHASGYNRAMGWITIEGFEIRNGYDGIKLYNLHDSTIRRNWIHHHRNQGILGNGTRVLIDSNTINNNGPIAAKSTSNLEHGIYMNGTAITITNNQIYSNMAYGIQLNGSSTSIYKPEKHAGPEFAASSNWTIANNTIAYNINRAGIVVWGSSCNNARIENNIFYENAAALSTSSPQGIAFTSTVCKGIRIRNNHFFASGSGGMVAIGAGAIEGVHYTQSGNILNVSSPAFLNAPATIPNVPNFALDPRSPAIDKGLLLDLPSTRFDGLGSKRPQGNAPDIGALEFVLGTHPIAPQEFTVH